MTTNQTPIPLTAIECQDAGSAISIMNLARTFCLAASYHPGGGETAKRNFPVTHTVWLAGTKSNFAAFKDRLENYRSIK